MEDRYSKKSDADEDKDPLPTQTYRNERDSQDQKNSCKVSHWCIDLLAVW